MEDATDVCLAIVFSSVFGVLGLCCIIRLCVESVCDPEEMDEVYYQIPHVSSGDSRVPETTNVERTVAVCDSV